jgi:hypothetical protein
VTTADEFERIVVAVGAPADLIALLAIVPGRSLQESLVHNLERPVAVSLQLLPTTNLAATP